MYYDYWDGRKFNVSSESKYANRSFVILPTKNHNRLNVLADKLLRQDIEIYQNTESIVANDVLLQNGEVKESFTIPWGGDSIKANLKKGKMRRKQTKRKNTWK